MIQKLNYLIVSAHSIVPQFNNKSIFRIHCGSCTWNFGMPFLNIFSQWLSHLQLLSKETSIPYTITGLSPGTAADSLCRVRAVLQCTHARECGQSEAAQTWGNANVGVIDFISFVSFVTSYNFIFFFFPLWENILVDWTLIRIIEINLKCI